MPEKWVQAGVNQKAVLLTHVTKQSGTVSSSWLKGGDRELVSCCSLVLLSLSEFMWSKDESSSSLPQDSRCMWIWEESMYLSPKSSQKFYWLWWITCLSLMSLKGMRCVNWFSQLRPILGVVVGSFLPKYMDWEWSLGGFSRPVWSMDAGWQKQQLFPLRHFDDLSYLQDSERKDGGERLARERKGSWCEMGKSTPWGELDGELPVLPYVDSWLCFLMETFFFFFCFITRLCELMPNKNK